MTPFYPFNRFLLIFHHGPPTPPPTPPVASCASSSRKPSASTTSSRTREPSACSPETAFPSSSFRPARKSSLAYGSIFGSWSVKVVNELDRCSKDAQDMLLTYLDRMKPGHAFLGTTNLDLGSLTERFQTRFQSVRLQPPENEVLAAFLAKRWRVPITITRQIAEGSQGNVRAALTDLEMWMG